MRLFVLIGVGGVAGAVLGVATRAPDGLKPAAVAGLVGALIGASIAAAIVGRFVGSRPFTLYRHVPIPAERVHRHAPSWFGRAPWVLVRNDGNELVYWRQQEANAGAAIIYFLLGVIPGVLYLLLSRSPQTVALAISPAPDGTELEIVVHPQGNGGRHRVIRFFNSLHQIVDPVVESRR